MFTFEEPENNWTWHLYPPTHPASQPVKKIQYIHTWTPPLWPMNVLSGYILSVHHNFAVSSSEQVANMELVSLKTIKHSTPVSLPVKIYSTKIFPWNSNHCKHIQEETQAKLVLISLFYFSNYLFFKKWFLPSTQFSQFLKLLYIYFICLSDQAFNWYLTD